MRPQHPSIYRARYTWPDGRASYVTFASVPHDALRWAGDYVRMFVQGELLSIDEQRPSVIQLSLT
jgi:hypothetical protein